MVHQFIQAEIAQQVGRQNLEGEIVEEGREAVGQRKLKAQVRKRRCLNLLPEIPQVFRHEAAAALEQRDRVEHILAGERGAVVPDRVFAQVDYVSGTLGRDLPIRGKIANGQSA